MTEELLPNGATIGQPDFLDEPLEVSPEEIIDAFEAVYEELVMLRNSVINLHERLEKLETPSNVSV